MRPGTRDARVDGRPVLTRRSLRCALLRPCRGPVVFSSDLCRFLSYGENREIVKDVLLDLGLKKVKLGIEAYVDPRRRPTSMARG